MKINKNLISNFLSLSSLQIASYILPIITVPYVVRVIGPGNYGLINFANSFIAYFVLIINFGFDLTASRDISFNRDNKEKISEIFYSVTAAKILLGIFCTVLFLILILLVPKFNQDSTLYIVTYSIIIGNFFYPTWFFQGIEKLSRTAFFSFLIRIVSTISIFFLIKVRNDYIFLQAIYSITQLIIGIAAFIYAIKIFKIKLCIPKFKKVINTLKESFALFVSSVVINIYTTSNVVILGFFATNIEVGYFSAAMKLMYVAIGIFLGPFSQTMYPYIANSFNKSFENGVLKLKKIFAIILIITLLTSLLIVILAPIAIKIMFGDQFLPAIITLQLISFLPFIIGVSSVCGTLGLLNLKNDKIILRISAFGALLNILFNILLTPFLLGNGTAIAWVLTEIYISAATFIKLKQKGIDLFSSKELLNLIKFIKLNNN
jgi:PST family polysaccharide transporter